MPDYLKYHLDKSSVPLKKEDEQKIIPEETTQETFDGLIDRMIDLYGKKYTEKNLFEINDKVNSFLDAITMETEVLIDKYNDLSHELDALEDPFNQLKSVDLKISRALTRLGRAEKEESIGSIKNEIEDFKKRRENMRIAISNMSIQGKELLGKYDFLQQLKVKIDTIRSIVAPLDESQN
jgi:SMC interacting uncharacterized protein involved in chromosome segregation